MSGRLIIHGATDPRENMAADEALLLHCERGGDGFPALRFYWWSQPTLSLGAKEKLADAANLEACRKLGIALVRRSTGGRAVLHNRELTYSIVGRSDREPFKGSVTESYRKIAEALRAGIASLGVELELADASREKRGRGAHLPCFAAPSRCELASGERKVVGSAQRRLRGAFLQHGSIIIDSEPDSLAAATGTGEDGRARLAASMAGISELLGRELERDDLIEALVPPLAALFGCELANSDLDDAERATRDSLLREGAFAVEAG